MGWIRKLGCHFCKFFRCMDQIGKWAIVLCKISTNQSICIYGKRLKAGKQRVWTLLLATLWLCSIACNAQFSSPGYIPTGNDTQPVDEPCNAPTDSAVDWEELSNASDVNCEHDDDISMWMEQEEPCGLPNGESASCCISAAPPVVAMTNDMDADGITNSNMDFSISNTQFGMDNCATHHICGNKNLWKLPVLVM